MEAQLEERSRLVRFVPFQFLCMFWHVHQVQSFFHLYLSSVNSCSTTFQQRKKHEDTGWRRFTSFSIQPFTLSRNSGFQAIFKRKKKEWKYAKKAQETNTFDFFFDMTCFQLATCLFFTSSELKTASELAIKDSSPDLSFNVSEREK